MAWFCVIIEHPVEIVDGVPAEKSLKINLWFIASLFLKKSLKSCHKCAPSILWQVIMKINLKVVI